MTLWIDETEVSRLLPLADAVEAVEDALRHMASGNAFNTPRRRTPASGGLLHMMSASDREWRVAGFKTYASLAGRSRFLVQLFDTTTGELAALIEADRLGQIRTGAASGVAARALARPGASRIGVIGTGWQAETQLEAVATVLGARAASVYSRRSEGRLAFASLMSERLGIDVTAVENPERAVRDHDVVITITTSGSPVIEGGWLGPGTLVVAAGSNHLSRREIDVATLRRCPRIYVDSRQQAALEAGDLLPVIDRGHLEWGSLIELGDVLVGRSPGRLDLTEILLYKSLGLAIQDIAVARIVLERARAEGLGRDIALGGAARRTR